MYRLNPAPAYYGQPPPIPPPFASSNVIPPYPPPRQGGPSPMYYDGPLTSQTPYRQLITNQNVKVLIEARGWVVGIIVGVLKAVDKVTHWGYTVRFKSGQNTMQKDFPAKDVYPIDGDM